MNAFIKKEIRLLLPNFAFACVLALAGLFFPNNPDSVLNGITYFLGCIFCPAVAVMLALSSFGVEVGSGTFSNLLAQPVSRLKIWETKITLLAAALMAVAFLWVVAFLINTFHSGENHGINDWLDLFSIVIVFGLVIFSGGLWTVLLLRQVAAAFWFALLVPGALLVIPAALFSEHDGNLFEGVIVCILGLYSLAGFFFARWLFFRAQDLQWSGGTIVMPEIRGIKMVTGLLRQWRPRAALWRKEFQLHQAQFVMAFALIVLHLGVIAARNIFNLKGSPDLKFILETFWALWLVMPLLVGCAAVAEERKLGTLGGQLCLPVKRRTQFVIKFSVVIFLSVLLGVVAPLLLEGTRILPSVHFDLGFKQEMFQQMSSAQIYFWSGLDYLNVFLPLLTFAAIAALIGLVAFYVSTLTRNTLQSLAPAVLALAVTWFLLVLALVPWQRGFDFLWHGVLAFFIAGPLLLLTLLVLTFRNFQILQPRWKTGASNLAMLVGALAFGIILSSAVYHRAWEKLTPFEPPHGQARLTPATPVGLSAERGDIIIRLPDGKVWMSWLSASSDKINPLALLLGHFRASSSDGKFINGSNWSSIQRAGWQVVGIKNDGTLWVSDQPVQNNRSRINRWTANREGMFQLAQFGNETNWSSLAPYSLYTLLVKNDGTLWRWGAMDFDFKHEIWPGLQGFTPQQMGTESNWAEVFQSGYQTCLYKTDDSGWATGDWNTNIQKLIEIVPGFIVHSTPTLRRGDFCDTTMISHGMQYMVGIHRDGTFRIWADQHLSWDKKHRYGNYEWSPANLPIGNGSNWLAVAGGWERCVTLKNDGTLWLWNFQPSPFAKWDPNKYEQEIQNTCPVRLGTHADWIAISGNSENVIALAADGSLWFWPLLSAEALYNNRSDTSGIHPLLDISRKPQLLGNIFTDSH